MANKIKDCLRNELFTILKLLPLSCGVIIFTLILVARFAVGVEHLDEFVLLESNFVLLLASAVGWSVTLIGLVAQVLDRLRRKDALSVTSHDFIYHAVAGAGYYVGAVWTLVEEDEIIKLFKEDLYAEYIRAAAILGLIACLAHWTHAGFSFRAWWLYTDSPGEDRESAGDHKDEVVVMGTTGAPHTITNAHNLNNSKVTPKQLPPLQAFGSQQPRNIPGTPSSPRPPTAVSTLPSPN